MSGNVNLGIVVVLLSLWSTSVAASSTPTTTKRIWFAIFIAIFFVAVVVVMVVLAIINTRRLRELTEQRLKREEEEEKARKLSKIVDNEHRKAFDCSYTPTTVPLDPTVMATATLEDDGTTDEVEPLNLDTGKSNSCSRSFGRTAALVPNPCPRYEVPKSLMGYYTAKMQILRTSTGERRDGEDLVGRVPSNLQLRRTKAEEPSPSQYTSLGPVDSGEVAQPLPTGTNRVSSPPRNTKRATLNPLAGFAPSRQSISQTRGRTKSTVM